jgi:hypothetical protein
MNVLFYFILALLSFTAAYRFYGKFIARSIGERKERVTAAFEIIDGKDYVPTRPSVFFADNHSTIALPVVPSRDFMLWSQGGRSPSSFLKKVSKRSSAMAGCFWRGFLLFWL